MSRPKIYARVVEVLPGPPLRLRLRAGEREWLLDWRASSGRWSSAEVEVGAVVKLYRRDGRWQFRRRGR